MKKLLLVAATVGTLTFVAPAANATSISTFEQHLDAVSSDLQDLSDAASNLDTSSVQDAAQQTSDDALTLLHDHRPHRVSRASWRHVRRAARLLIEAADQAITGIDENDPDLVSGASDLINEATDEFTAAKDAL